MMNARLRNGYFLLLISLLFSIVLCCSNQALSENLRVPTDPDLNRLGTRIRQRIQLTPEERNYLNAKHLIHVRVGDYPPFHFNEEGTPRGLSIDYLRTIAAVYGLDFDYVPGMNVPQSLMSMKQAGGIAVQPAWHRNAEREQVAIFIRPYVNSPYVIFKRRDSERILGMDDLVGKQIVVEKGYAIHRILQQHFPEFLLQEVDTSTLALKNLAGGKADTYIGSLMVGYYLIQKLGLSNLEVTAPTPLEPNLLHIAVRKDWPQLASLMDKAMAAMTDDEHRKLRSRWFNVPVKGLVSKKKVFKYFMAVASLVLFLLLIGALFVNKRLHREIKAKGSAQRALKKSHDELENRVEERTAKLSDANKALLDSENRYRSLSDAAFEGIVLIDDGKIVETNKACLNMFGYQLSEFIGKGAIDFIILDEREKVKSRILSGYEQPYETQGLKKDGSSFPMEVHGKMFSYKGREIRVTAIRDLTEQKKAEEEIKALRGILPICANCKKIRDDKGYWKQIESYIVDHSDAEFSHGICQECAKKLYPDLDIHSD